jgi:hypothetical protein
VNLTDNTLVFVAVFALILWRQVRVRTVREERPFLLMGALAVVGVLETRSFADSHPVSAEAWALLTVSLVVAAGLGVVRGLQLRVWRADGTLLQRGTALTVLLWVLGLAVHLGIDGVIDAVDGPARGIGLASLLLYLGVALAAQRAVVLQRAATFA